MNSIILPPDLERRVDELARRSGKPTEELVRLALMQGIEDIEDAIAAEVVLDRIGKGKEGTETLSDVEARLGLAD